MAPLRYFRVLGYETQWTAANYVLAVGEIGIEIDTGLFKVGDGVSNWSSLPYSSNVGGATGPAGATGTSSFGTMMVWNAGTSTNTGEMDGWAISMSFNEESLYGSATNFFTALTSLYPWQTIYLNATDSTGQYATISVSNVTYSSGVYTVSGGLVVQNGSGTFSGTVYTSYYISTVQNGVTGETGEAGGATGATGEAGGATGATGTIGATGQSYSDYLYWNRTLQLWQPGSTAVHIGREAGLTLQGENSIAIGTNAGKINQLSNSIAIGLEAGCNAQNIYSIAIGTYAAHQSQSFESIAIGLNAGNTNQSNRSLAIGPNAGSANQGPSSIAIGEQAGYDTQLSNSIAIGSYAGNVNQSSNSIAIGNSAGYLQQSNDSIAIGNSAGLTNQGCNAIAIGRNAGTTDQSSNSIIINASNSSLETTNPGFYIAPIRNDNTQNLYMAYNTSTKEVVYKTNGGATGATGTNGTNGIVGSNGITGSTGPQAFGSWISAGTIQSVGWGATTTAPTVGGTTRNNISYRQLGPKEWEVALTYQILSMGDGGSGDYLFTLPNSLQFDTTLPFQTAYTLNVGGNTWVLAGFIIPSGSGLINNGGVGGQVYPIVYDSTRYRILTTSYGSAIQCWSDNYYGLTSTCEMTFKFTST